MNDRKHKNNFYQTDECCISQPASSVRDTINFLWDLNDRPSPLCRSLKYLHLAEKTTAVLISVFLTLFCY